MMRTLLTLGSVIAFATALPHRPASHHFNASNYNCDEVIDRDVVIIGGGASGTYAAIALQDQGKSVAVVEKKAVFGGHVATYSVNGTAIDFGVQAYVNNTLTRNFFDRFDVPLIKSGFPTTSVYQDFTSLQILSNFSRNFTLGPYINQLNTYDYSPTLGWSLPNPIPEDLFLTFQDFITKYALENIAWTIASLINGNGNILDQLMLYIFSSFNDVTFAEITEQTGVTTRNNSELYGKAQVELGSDALTSSEVVFGDRSDAGVELVVRSEDGKVKLLRASQLIISAPLVLDNLSPFGLDDLEHAVFSKVYGTAYYVALLNNTGLAPGHTYNNVGADTFAHIPVPPVAYLVSATPVPGYFYVWYGNQTPLEEPAVKQNIISTVKALSNGTTSPEIVAFSSHTPYKQQVAEQDIREGFYDTLNGLQGYRNTWYTGQFFDSSGSSSLWQFTENLLPAVIGKIEAVNSTSTRGSANRCRAAT